jgi:hypothetical protein
MNLIEISGRPPILPGLKCLIQLDFAIQAQVDDIAESQRVSPDRRLTGHYRISGQYLPFNDNTW